MENLNELLGTGYAVTGAVAAILWSKGESHVRPIVWTARAVLWPVIAAWKLAFTRFKNPFR